MVLDGKSSQKYPVNAGVPQGFILGLTLFLLYINDLPDDVICDIVIYADATTLYSKCDQASDFWRQLELASELEFDLQVPGFPIVGGTPPPPHPTFFSKTPPIKTDSPHEAPPHLKMKPPHLKNNPPPIET